MSVWADGGNCLRLGSQTLEAQQGGVAISQQGRGQRKRGPSVEWEKAHDPGPETRSQTGSCHQPQQRRCLWWDSPGTPGKGQVYQAVVSQSQTWRLGQKSNDSPLTSFYCPTHGFLVGSMSTGGSYQRHGNEKNLGHITTAESAAILLVNLVYSWTSVTL